ncbi:MAG TPA: LLM class F420-dependent oxidoreductase [Acidimicrobiia bacterium]|nr:LLM class F420-dependent oxidoreductase [Acidimicrobiia bacterium]
MRFGAFIPQGWTLDLVGIEVEEQWPTMIRVAETLESSGFESGWVYDHFHTVPQVTQEPTYEAWSLMAALAVATDRLRLGQMCTCNSYRPPAYLAHVAASIDVISGGRLEMGIGAGWFEGEYRAHGYPFPKPSVRIGQLGEALEVMRRMWTEDEAHFDGEYYELDGAVCRPKPLQQPHIPYWVAGGGEKLTLNVAARYADYTNFAGSPENFAHKSEVLAGHCREVGRNFDDITRTMNMSLVCASTEAEAHELLDEVEGRMSSLVEDEARLQRFLAEARRRSGPPDKIIEQIRPYAEVGMSYLIVRFPGAAYDRSGIELFGREVIGAI